jgi:hypothetical protein
MAALGVNGPEGGARDWDSGPVDRRSQEEHTTAAAEDPHGDWIAAPPRLGNTSTIMLACQCVG